MICLERKIFKSQITAPTIFTIYFIFLKADSVVLNKKLIRLNLPLIVKNMSLVKYFNLITSKIDHWKSFKLLNKILSVKTRI